MNSIRIEIEIDDERLLDTVSQTIEVELYATRTDRGEVRLESTQGKLILIILGSDLIATRAMVNSILRLVQTSIDVANSIGSSPT